MSEPSPIGTSASIYGTSSHLWTAGERRGPGRALTTASALRALGPIVYAVRLTDGLIKIGHSADFAQRRRCIGGHSSEMLAVIPGATRADEQAIHAQLTDHVHHGREYYNPTPGVLQVVNRMREQIGLDHPVTQEASP